MLEKKKKTHGRGCHCGMATHWPSFFFFWVVNSFCLFIYTLPLVFYIGRFFIYFLLVANKNSPFLPPPPFPCNLTNKPYIRRKQIFFFVGEMTTDFKEEKIKQQQLPVT